MFVVLLTGPPGVGKSAVLTSLHDALADEDVNHLSRFLAPQFRVHPELQKLARKVYEQHPAARKFKPAVRRGAMR